MSTQKKALGRGLGALIPSRPAEPAAPPQPSGMPGAGLAEVPIEQISPNPYQPRKTFNEASIEELAAMKKQGKLVLREQEHVFDQAMHRVMGRLQSDVVA